MPEIADCGWIEMKKVDRFLIGALALGVWALVVFQLTSIDKTYAQEAQVVEKDNENIQKQIDIIHANDVVGLNAMIEKAIRQSRPQSISGLDQYIKSIVRKCRITGSVRGDQITSANISC
jgi:fatty acid/phospholipid biosynthesis enzyme